MWTSTIAFTATFFTFGTSRTTYEATFGNSVEWTYYDGRGDQISEEEYIRQAHYELEHGIPYIRDRELEQANLNKPIDLLVHSGFTCDQDTVVRVTEEGCCCEELRGESVVVKSLPSNCELITFADGFCRHDPFVMIPIVSLASGCYSTDIFKSVRVVCRPLPL